MKISKGTLSALIAASLVTLLLTACVGAVNNNLEDGYQPGDVSEGLKSDKAWYCGEGMMGIRSVARFVLRGFGVPVFDVCKAIDIVVDSEESEQ